MAFFTIISRYLFRGVLAPFVVCLFILTSVLFLARVLKFVDLVINKNVPLLEVTKLFAFVVPGFLEIAIPMALLISVILLFSRLSVDCELVAMRASGMTLARLSRPILFFAVLVWFGALGISIWLRPWADYRLGQGMYELARNQASSGLVAGIFNPFGQMTIYAEQVLPKVGDLDNVIIADNRDSSKEQVFFAKKGRIISDDKERTISLKLVDGSVQQGWGADFNITYFDVNNFTMGADDILSEPDASKGKKIREMGMGELNQSLIDLDSKVGDLSNEDLERLRRGQVEFHRRLAIPTSCLCVVLLAMALGIQPNRAEHSWGAGFSIAIGVFFIVIYYMFTGFLNTLGEEGVAPAWLLSWLPNVGFMALSFYLFKQVESERWLAISEAVGDHFISMKSWLNRVLSVSNLRVPSHAG